MVKLFYNKKSCSLYYIQISRKEYNELMQKLSNFENKDDAMNCELNFFL